MWFRFHRIAIVRLARGGHAVYCVQSLPQHLCQSSCRNSLHGPVAEVMASTAKIDALRATAFIFNSIHRGALQVPLADIMRWPWVSLAAVPLLAAGAWLLGRLRVGARALVPTSALGWLLVVIKLLCVAIGPGSSFAGSSPNTHAMHPTPSPLLRHSPNAHADPIPQTHTSH